MGLLVEFVLFPDVLVLMCSFAGSDASCLVVGHRVSWSIRPKHVAYFYNEEKSEQQPQLHVDGKSALNLVLECGTR
jgi:hypothetical protein